MQVLLNALYIYCCFISSYIHLIPPLGPFCRMELLPKINKIIITIFLHILQKKYVLYEGEFAPLCNKAQTEKFSPFSLRKG